VVRSRCHPELAFLANYDKTKKAIQEIVDMPDRQIDLFIRFCLQNNGQLSGRKRASHFDFLLDEEIASLEQAVMNPKDVYRLGEYRISEFVDDRLWWDAHSGFGMRTGGPCFVYGNILVMGPRRYEENGLLILEHLDTLKSLPLWNRTRYYCYASALLDVTTGGNISEDELHHLVSLPPEASDESRGITPDRLETFRLWQYQISIAPEGDISWKACGGMSHIVGGPVLIESGVLFIGPPQYDDPLQNKRQFLHTLPSFPKWDRTGLWCRSIALKPVMLQGKPALHAPPQNKGGRPRTAMAPVRTRPLEYLKQIGAQMTGYYGQWVEAVKRKWP
jgi:hypothetical protein